MLALHPMDTPRPDKTHPDTRTPNAVVGGRAVWALLPIPVVVVASYFLYMASPVLLLLAGAAALGGLTWWVAKALLTDSGPAWVAPAVAGGIWLVYAMRLVYGWRAEMGYLASLWHVFGWTFLSTLFWGLMFIGAVRLFEKMVRS